MNNILHLGYPKAASTSLQRQIFAAAEDHAYVSRVTNGASSEGQAVYDLLSDTIMKGAQFRRAREALETFTRGRPYIYSDERIMFPSGATNLTPYERIAACATLFGPAHVFLVLRRPLEQLRSLYEHYMQHQLRHTGKGVHASIGAWLGDAPETSLTRRGDMSAAIHYGTIVEQVCERFGREHVTCVFLDDFRREGQTIYPRLAALLGVRAAPELSETMANRSEQNKWVRRIRKDPDYNSEVPPALQARLHDITLREAERLRRATGLDVPETWTQD